MEEVVLGKSGGINSKFGLTSTEILEAYELMEDNEFS